MKHMLALTNKRVYHENRISLHEFNFEKSINFNFRLKSFSVTRYKETVKNNLNHLLKILEFNLKNNILFFRKFGSALLLIPHF